MPPSSVSSAPIRELELPAAAPAAPPQPESVSTVSRSEPVGSGAPLSTEPQASVDITQKPESLASLDPSDHGLVHRTGTTLAACSGFAPRGLYGSGTLVVVDDGGGVGGALIEELRRRGLKSHLVDSIDRLPRSTRGIIFCLD